MGDGFEQVCVTLPDGEYEAGFRYTSKTGFGGCEGFVKPERIKKITKGGREWPDFDPAKVRIKIDHPSLDASFAEYVYDEDEIIYFARRIKGQEPI